MEHYVSCKLLELKEQNIIDRDGYILDLVLSFDNMYSLINDTYKGFKEAHDKLKLLESNLGCLFFLKFTIFLKFCFSVSKTIRLISEPSCSKIVKFFYA